MYVQIQDKEEDSKEDTVEEEPVQQDHSTFVPESTFICYPKARETSLFKRGRYTARKRHAPNHKIYFHMQDVFTSLIESRWRVTLFVFSLSFLGTWLLFGLLWWAVAHEYGNLKGYANYDKDSPQCVTAMDDFISCFLFSLETQYSTGYGTRSPTTECPEATALLIVQSIFGVLIQSTMAGIVFVKLSRPKARTQHIVFSKTAVICLRDGHLSLLFRVGDFRKSHIVGATVRAWLLQHRVTQEGEILPHYQHGLKLNIDSGGSDAFLIWPSTVLHIIDETSPLFDIDAMDLLTAKLEIVVVLNGTVETTGQTTEARTSYLPSRILWGHRFKQMIKCYRKRQYDFAVDYSRFDDTVPVDTPLCSARKLCEWNIPQTPVSPVSSIPLQVVHKTKPKDESVRNFFPNS